MPLQFTAYIGIDYSGAQTPASSLKGLRVYMADRQTLPVEIEPPPSPRKYWTRRGLADWLVDQLGQDPPTLVGIDHGFSFPLRYFEVHHLPPDWPAFLEDFHRHWPTDEDHRSPESLRYGNPRTGHHSEFRLAENWTASAQSVFKLDGAGTVGKSTHCGIPWLRFIRRNAAPDHRPHFWPFDGFEIPPNQSVIVEIFPSLLRKRYAKRENHTPDDHDAMCVAQGYGWPRLVEHLFQSAVNR